MATATAAPVIDLSDAKLLAWCKGIARGIRGVIRKAIRNAPDDDARRCCRFDRGSDEEHDLEQVALTEMVSVAVGLNKKGKPRFDPERCPAGGDLIGYFKGVAHPWIKFAVLKAARKLSNGGIGRELVDVVHQSARETPTGRDADEIEVPDPRSLRPPDPADPPPPPPPPSPPPPTGGPPAAPLAAFDAYLATLSAELQAPFPPVPPAFVPAYTRNLRAEMAAAEEAREHLDRLLSLAGEHSDLGAAARQVLAGCGQPG
jgi:hypothetical protein